MRPLLNALVLSGSFPFLLKRLVRKTLRLLGIEVHRFDSGATKNARLMAALNSWNINTILDVGANEGQFGEELRSCGYAGTIISFEPVSHAHRRLLLRSERDPHWRVAPRIALGATRGIVHLNVAANSVSSSILPMLEAHRKAAPESVYTSNETVQLLPLDEAAAPFLRDRADRILIKIDTQGYEWNVLDGSPEILSRAQAVLIELSIVPLYEKQHLWRDCIARLESLGFTLWALEPVFIDATNGKMLQMDGLFVRK